MDDSSGPSESSNVRKKPRKDQSECQICAAPASYSYYGVIACSPCKVFFKRYAKSQQEQFKCQFTNHCEINHLDAHHRCSACWLAKCFASGMQIELFRSSNQQTKMTTNALVKQTERNEPPQLPTLSLLRSDHSGFTSEQWNLLSNTIHCYDEYSKFPTAEHFIHEQNNLPIKMRFKLGPTGELFTACVRGAQLLFEKNAYFVSLCAHDRSLLLHSTMKHICNLGSCFVLHRTGLFDNPAFCKAGEILYGMNIFNFSKQAIIQLDSDLTFPKLILAILIFSTPDYVHYTNTAPDYFKDAKTILYIQTMYVELAWRYLLYKYDHYEAILCFLNLIRCLFTLNHAIVEAEEYQQYTDMIESFIKQAEEKIAISD